MKPASVARRARWRPSPPHRLLAAGLGLLVACSDTPRGHDPSPATPTAATPKRRPLDRPPPTVTRAALPEASANPDRWLAALASPDPQTRDLAVLAYGLLDPPPPAPMARALAAESDPARLGRLLQAAGRAHPPLPAEVFHVALSRGAPDVQAGACLGMAVSSLPASQLPHAELSRWLDPNPEARAAPTDAVRLACALALSQIPVPTEREDLEASALALDAALRDPEPEVRLAAATALVRYATGPLQHLREALSDPDWRVAAASYRAFALHASEEDYDHALDALTARALADAAVVTGSRLRVWESALRTAAHLPSSATRLAHAEALLDRFAEARLAAPASPEVAAAHCELAAWVDAQRRWPGRLRGCGDGLAPASLVYFHEARVVAAQPSDPALRATYLMRMLQRGPEARTAVLSSASRVHDASLLPALVDLLGSGTDADAGRAARVAVELASLPGVDATVRAELGEALQHRLRALPAGASPLTLVAVLDALATLEHPTTNPGTVALLRHPSPVVAAAARRQLAAVLDPAEIPAAELPPDAPASPPVRPLELTLQLTAGQVRIALDPTSAPRSVAALAGAIGAGWLDQAPLSPRSQPMEVRVGDPYASAPGASAPHLPRTPGPAACERGSVLLVAAGPHSDTLALRVLLSRRPELDGVATPVGRVVEGLQRLEASIHGQVVEAAAVHPAGEPQPPRAERTESSP